ncbi:methionine ABC transporter ATP-binding protein [Yanshouia hominis]|uniref:methionine ABC transporter ATP-binding protein n=1 Tax=Yanshouia hominis TaxID=2763673 RepID=UPI0034DB721A
MIKLKNINKVFTDSDRKVYAVQDVNLAINEKDIFGIIGFSGAGKSTLVRCINLLERPTSGTIEVEGSDLTKLSSRELRIARKKIGMIFQHFNLMPSRTIFNNVAYPLQGSGLTKQQIKDRVHELLELVGISEKENAYPSQLSGGQKQRVAIARALANNPNILLCDEATSALDPQTTKSILRLLQKLNDSIGITIVIITHEMSVIKEICNRVAVMDHGKVIEEGEVFSVFSAPEKELTRNFIKTTSNLQKIEELLETNSSMVTIRPGELIVRLSYVEKNASEPLISIITKKFDITLNIIFANIEIVQSAPVGGTVAIVSGERKQIDQALAYLREKM